MSMTNRAAQFAPFAALVGYDDAIAETARATDQAVELSSDLTSLLDVQLSQLQKALEEQSPNPVEVRLTHFVPDQRKEGGHYANITAAVKGIDETARRIMLSDGHVVNIENIIHLKSQYGNHKASLNKT